MVMKKRLLILLALGMLMMGTASAQTTWTYETGSSAGSIVDPWAGVAVTPSNNLATDPTLESVEVFDSYANEVGSSTGVVIRNMDTGTTIVGPTSASVSGSTVDIPDTTLTRANKYRVLLDVSAHYGGSPPYTNGDFDVPEGIYGANSDGSGGSVTTNDVFNIVGLTYSTGPTNSPPTADFTYSPSSPAIGESISFDGSGSSDPDGDALTYSWDWDNDGTYEGSGQTASHSYSSAGSYDVTLQVDDGSATDTQTQTVTVTDQTAPSYSNLAPADNTYHTSTPTISGDVSDNNDLSQVELFVDGTSEATQSVTGTSDSFSFSPSLTEGSHTWYIEVTDSAGNTASSTQRTFTVDTTNPSFSNFDADGLTTGEYTNDNTITLSADFSDNIALDRSIWYVRDGTDSLLADYPKFGSISGTSDTDTHTVTLPDGEYDFGVGVEDQAGNTDFQFGIVDNITIDTETPSYNFSSSFSESNDELTMTVEASEELSGISGSYGYDYYNTNTDSVETFTQSLSLSDFSQSGTTYTATLSVDEEAETIGGQITGITDLAGNTNSTTESTSQSYGDDVAPRINSHSVTIFSGGSNGYYGPESSLEFTADTEDLQAKEVTISPDNTFGDADDITISEAEGRVTTTQQFQAGSRNYSTYYVQVQESSGNQLSTTTSGSGPDYDNTAPTVDGYESTGDATVPEFFLEVNATDSQSGLDGGEWQIDTSNFGNVSLTLTGSSDSDERGITFTTLNEGVYDNQKIYVSDGVGNTQTVDIPSQDEWAIDGTDPRVDSFALTQTSDTAFDGDFVVNDNQAVRTAVFKRNGNLVERYCADQIGNGVYANDGVYDTSCSGTSFTDASGLTIDIQDSWSFSNLSSSDSFTLQTNDFAGLSDSSTKTDLVDVEAPEILSVEATVVNSTQTTADIDSEVTVGVNVTDQNTVSSVTGDLAVDGTSIILGKKTFSDGDGDGVWTYTFDIDKETDLNKETLRKLRGTLTTNIRVEDNLGNSNISNHDTGLEFDAFVDFRNWYAPSPPSEDKLKLQFKSNDNFTQMDTVVYKDIPESAANFEFRCKSLGDNSQNNNASCYKNTYPFSDRYEIHIQDGDKVVLENPTNNDFLFTIERVSDNQTITQDVEVKAGQTYEYNISFLRDGDSYVFDFGEDVLSSDAGSNEQRYLADRRLNSIKYIEESFTQADWKKEEIDDSNASLYKVEQFSVSGIGHYDVDINLTDSNGNNEEFNREAIVRPHSFAGDTYQTLYNVFRYGDWLWGGIGAVLFIFGGVVLIEQRLGFKARTAPRIWFVVSPLILIGSGLMPYAIEQTLLLLSAGILVEIALSRMIGTGDSGGR